MVKSAVRVCVRTRPTSNFASDTMQVDTSSNTMHVKFKKDETQFINNQLENMSFTVNDLLHNVTQESLYNQCARGVVDSVLQGYNGTVMCYGQTGAGKTFTMSGSTESYEYRGIIPRAIAQVFNEVNERSDQAFTIRVSYLELYNEVMFDLLADSGSEEQELLVMEDAHGATIVKGLQQKIANTEEEALNYLFEGETNRAIAEHQLNSASSRSHCIFTIHIETRSRIESREKILRSKLNLVDLAGSERVKKTGSEGQVLKEASFINKSLSFLEQVVMALSEKNREHIPYRSTKLTNVLRDSLGGNCKTFLIANVWPESRHLQETVSTLRFATRMMHVSNEATLNIEYDPQLLVKKYEKEIRLLKQELAMHDSFANRTTGKYDEFTPEQRYELKQQVTSYLRGEQEDLQFESMRHAQELFNQFKILYKELEQAAPRAAVTQSDSATAATAQPTSSNKEAQQQDTAEGVGDVVRGGGGFTVESEAPAAARPTGLKSTAARTTTMQRSATPVRPSTTVSSKVQQTRAPSQQPSMDKADAFNLFKESDGAALNAAMVESKREFLDKKKQLKQLADSVNSTKRSIDDVRRRVEEKQRVRLQNQEESSADENAEIIDEEEFLLLKQLKDEKKAYREMFTQLQQMKSEVDYSDRLVESNRLKLVNEFDAWYSRKFSSAVDENAAQLGGDVDGDDNDDDDDEMEFMDEQERFRKLEMERVLRENPDALPFFNARKSLQHKPKATQPSSGVIRPVRPNAMKPTLKKR